MARSRKNKPTTNNFGAWLTGERARLKVSQKGLEALSDNRLDASTIATHERDGRAASVEFIVGVCNVLRLTPEELARHLHEDGHWRKPEETGNSETWWMAQMKQLFRGLSEDQILAGIAGARAMVQVALKQAKNERE